jgi:hypothetical protein
MRSRKWIFWSYIARGLIIMRPLYYSRKLFQTPLSYTCGRFYLFRAVYSRCVRLRQVVGGKRLPPLNGLSRSEILCMDPRAAVAALRRDALAEAISVPPTMVAEIKEFARQAECKVAGLDTRFRYADVKDGKLPDGTFVALGHCLNPTQCPAVCKIRDDPVLLSIVANYLGYVPLSGDIWLYWSFAGEATDNDRRLRYQTIDYHYDIHDYNFCYVHVYLTDTDVNSGAHVMVRGSHKSKPISWLLGSARQTDTAVETHYGKERVVLLEGKAGAGFIEDTSCFHKALAPVSRDRLLLQIRYH